MPTSPGSSSEADAFTATGAARFTARACVTTARSRRPRTSRTTSNNPMPASHTPISQGSRWMVCGWPSSRAGSARGSARIRISRGATWGSTTCGNSAESRAPSAASQAKGTRNLREAANHNPKRTPARLARKARVSDAAASAKRVDCQR